MKNFKNLIFITLLILTANNFSHARFSLAPSAYSTETGEMNHYSRTEEQTYTKKTCGGGYRKLKKILKKDAKDFCGGKLGQTSWFKKNCEKIKVKGHKTKVTVKATFNAICRY